MLHRAGRIDLLVNNAGYALGGALEENTVSDTQAQFDTNVFGAPRLINAVLPTMRRQGHGQIISVSSLLGVVALPYLSLYSSSKFALEGMMEGLRSEVRPFNIVVSLVEPTFFKTNFVVQAPTRPLADYAPFRESVLQSIQQALVDIVKNTGHVSRSLFHSVLPVQLLGTILFYAVHNPKLKDLKTFMIFHTLYACLQPMVYYHCREKSSFLPRLATQPTSTIVTSHPTQQKDPPHELQKPQPGPHRRTRTPAAHRHPQPRRRRNAQQRSQPTIHPHRRAEHHQASG